MRLRTLFRLFLLLAAVAPITTAKADSLIIGTDTLRLDLHWLDDTPLDELKCPVFVFISHTYRRG